MKLKLVDKVIYILNVVAALLLLLSYLLPYLPPKAFSVLSVISLGVVFLLLINLLFFLYWLLRLKRQFFLSLIVSIIGYFIYGTFYEFSTTDDSIEVVKSIKVMNYNVRMFNLYEWIPQKGIDSEILDFVKTESPDILSVQEFHPNQNMDFSFFKYKYEKLSGKKTKSGQVIFSKFPIINSGSVEFENTSNNAIFADIVKNKDTIRVYNIHLESMHINTNVDSLKKEKSERLFKRIGKTFEMQQSQTEQFLKHKEACEYKMIVCGDFNNTSFSYVYRKIKGDDLIDTFKEAGNGFGRTYDFKFFPIRIDYILTDETFAVNDFKVYKERYSDHYPIMATVSLE
ncbi:endonuclease/exonuclease/phosphatase family protein [Flavobacteriaceae bacterium XHP0103]|uniref:endonuclease/exonuclease/phosphatase family protein n=1 Tax=Marixanthotalea marina TaxID=2844359 RepID=UPI002989CA6E|nr:endonuclease/exonuclease/phosphatase family protein [Marixanthotalea marina]MBU3822631.1 endonuclease/exonuclease/phosphatase family protein [Marixanthotalea marina]